MANEHNRKGAMSRRKFFKATTAATTVASVGILSSMADVNSRRGDPCIASSPAWQITDKEIHTLWHEIWPKIVALKWLNPLKGTEPNQVSYLQAFEGNREFRVEEVHRIAQHLDVQYNSQVPICITSPADLNIGMEEFADLFDDNYEPSDTLYHPTPPTTASCDTPLYGNTFFLLTPCGFVMPWPEEPDIRDIRVGYMQGGGLLPRTSPPPPVFGSNAWRIIYLWVRPTPIRTLEVCPVDGLSGVALFTLFAKWPKVVALTWLGDGDGTGQLGLVQGNLRRYIQPDVWSRWPTVLDPTPGANLTSLDFSFGHAEDAPTIKMTVPLSAQPANVDRIFNELIAGFASNPMYTNSY